MAKEQAHEPTEPKPPEQKPGEKIPEDQFIGPDGKRYYKDGNAAVKEA